MDVSGGEHPEGNAAVTADNRLGVELGESFKQFAPGVSREDILETNPLR